MVNNMWPTRRFGPRVRFLVSGLQLIGAGLAGPWALGVLVLVGIVSTNISGSSTLLGLPLAAILSLLAAVCREEVESGRAVLSQMIPARRRSRRRARPPEFALCLSAWMDLLTYLAALAVCSRALSSTMDYITGGKSDSWFKTHFGTLPPLLGGRTPDIIGLGVVMVTSVLFMLGMEHSNVLRAFLNTSIIGCVIFLGVVGSQHTDIENWEPRIFGLLPTLTGAAVCSFGFLGFLGIHNEGKSHGKKFQLAAILVTNILALVTYCAVSSVLTLMVQFRTLEGSPVPLVKVFEVRDVDWARLVMAIFIIFGLSMSVLEICPPLHAVFVRLSSDECRMLPQAFSVEHPATGTAVGAILTTGIMAGLAALISQLEPLINLMCVGPLIGHSIAAAVLLYRRYQPPMSYLAEFSDVKYKRLGRQELRDDEDMEEDETDPESQQRRRHITVRCLKSGLNFLPAVIRQHVAAENQRYYTTVASPDFISGDMSHSLSNGTIVSAISGDESVVQKPVANGTLSSSSRNYLACSPSSVYASRLEPGNVPNGSAIHLHDDDVNNGNVVNNNLKSAVPKHFENSKYINGYLSPINHSLCESGSKFNHHSEFSAGNMEEKQNKKRNSKRNTSRDDEISLIKDDVESEDEEDSTTSDGDADESDNSTDIDAIVAEYKERIKVATTPTTPEAVAEGPTAGTARRASFAITASVLCAVAASISPVLPGNAIFWCGVPSIIGFTSLLLILSRQPQNKESWRSVPGVPWLPGVCLLLSILCSFQLLAGVWSATFLWILGGCAMYWIKHGKVVRVPLHRRGVSNRRERIRLNTPPRQSTMTTLVSSHRRSEDSFSRLTHVDTVTISR